MNILDHFTSIDDLLIKLLERIGGVTEEDTHFFSYPNDGSRATITKGTTTLDFMSGTVMTPAGLVSNLGNSLRARGREYCRSLSLQADRDIIIQIGTKSKIPVFAGTWFKVAHLRFTDLKIVAAEDTKVFAIACTNPDSIEMVGESYVKDPVDVWGKTTTIGNAELAVRTHAPPITYDRRGTVIAWADFETATRKFGVTRLGTPSHGRSTDTALHGDFSYKISTDDEQYVELQIVQNNYAIGRLGWAINFATEDTNGKVIGTMHHFDGALYSLAKVYYKTSTGQIYYYNSAGGYTLVDTVGRESDINLFSSLKMVVDFDKQEYVRFLCFGNEYDLSGEGLFTLVDGTPKIVYAGAYSRGLDALQSVVYFDDLILTEDEPI